MSARPFWYCEKCNAQNHESDGECQYCEHHEFYVSGEDWDRAGRPDDPTVMPCSRCGELERWHVIAKTEAVS